MRSSWGIIFLTPNLELQSSWGFHSCRIKHVVRSFFGPCGTFVLVLYFSWYLSICWCNDHFGKVFGAKWCSQHISQAYKAYQAVFECGTGMPFGQDPNGIGANLPTLLRKVPRVFLLPRIDVLIYPEDDASHFFPKALVSAIFFEVSFHRNRESPCCVWSSDSQQLANGSQTCHISANAYMTLLFLSLQKSFPLWFL